MVAKGTAVAVVLGVGDVRIVLVEFMVGNLDVQGLPAQRSAVPSIIICPS